jgi:hypothetical protein
MPCLNLGEGNEAAPPSQAALRAPSKHSTKHSQFYLRCQPMVTGQAVRNRTEPWGAC